MSRRLRAYLELVRVFLTPTAIADSAAGFLGATAPASWGDVAWGRLAMAAAASVAVYWLGMAANDVFDRRKDLHGAPGKPLPSGRVTLPAAAALCAVLGATAMAIAAVLGAPWAALGLLAAVITYDAGAKDVPVAGNLVMGACRGMNFLWGAACAAGEHAAFTDTRLLLAASLLGLFIAGVTAVSRLEDAPFDAAALRRRALPLLGVPVALAAAAWWEPAAHWNALFLGAMLWFGLRAAIAAGSRPSPRFHGAQVFVRQALPGLFLVDAGLVAALLSAPSAALTRRLAMLGLYALYLCAWLWKKAWLRRGSSGS